MSQPSGGDIQLSDQSGANYLAEHNEINQALASQHKGSTAPIYAVTGMIWLDDSATPWILKQYDGTDWISIGEVHATNNTFRLISQADGDTLKGVPTIQQVQKSSVVYKAATGSSNTYEISLSPAPAGYTVGMHVRMKANHTNTDEATINVNSLGNKSIKNTNGGGLVEGQITDGIIYDLVYDGTVFVAMGVPEISTQAEAEAGTKNNKIMTPLRVAQAIDALAGGGGGGVEIARQEITSSVPSVTFSSGFSNSYKIIYYEFWGVRPVSNAHFLGRTSSDGGTTYDATAGDYDFARKGLGSNNADLDTSWDAATYFSFMNNVGNASDGGINGLFYLYDPMNSSLKTQMQAFLVGINNNGYSDIIIDGGRRDAADIVNSVQFYFSTADVAAGTIIMKGIQ